MLVVDDGASGEWELTPDQARDLAHRLVAEAATSEFLEQEHRARSALSMQLWEGSLTRATAALVDLGFSVSSFSRGVGAGVAGRLPDGCEFILDMDDETEAVLRVKEMDGTRSAWTLSPDLAGERHVRWVMPHTTVTILEELCEQRRAGVSEGPRSSS